MNAAEMLKDVWFINGGTIPCNGHVKVDTKWLHSKNQWGDEARTWCWSDVNLTHWRLHNAACGNSWKSLEDNHLNTGNLNTENIFTGKPATITAAEYIKAINVPQEQPLGLPLSRVCKAFEAITGHHMSEEHAETFLKVVEMCKGFAVVEDNM